MILAVISTNKGKLAEISAFMKDLPISVHSIKVAVEETGTTFAENAIQKVMALPLKNDTIYLADDSGLEVESLNNRPGIYSARYQGSDATDVQRCEAILAELNGEPSREARFQCVIALRFPDGRIETHSGTVHGQISQRYQGDNGFGYDPIFIPDGFSDTFGVLPPEIKNHLSHRAIALRQAKQALVKTLLTP